MREQLGLFEADDERQRKVVEAADEVRERFGTRAITRARLLRTGIPAPFERDLGTAVERRGEHAVADDEAARRRKRRPPGSATNPDPVAGAELGSDDLPMRDDVLDD